MHFSLFLVSKKRKKKTHIKTKLEFMPDVCIVVVFSCKSRHFIFFLLQKLKLMSTLLYAAVQNRVRESVASV